MDHPDTRYRKNQKITRNQKKDLLTFVAGAGGNYQKYLEFCARFNIQTFSAGYWRNFQQRNRRAIQEYRRQHIAAVAAEARLDRKARQTLLEDDIARIEKIFEEDGEELTVDQIVKLTDQKRKTLEAIAKERGEWLAKEEEPATPYFAEALSGAAKKMKELEAAAAVEGEFRELPAA